MKSYIVHDTWKIIERGFNPALNRNSESIFSLGNGHFGQRANFEETYSGDSLQGNYVAGVYYPDKTKVGWWKNGYPEYFAKVLNATNWIGLRITFGDELLDLATWEVIDYYRELDMKSGILRRNFTAKSPSGKQISIKSSRICSMAKPETAALQYSITSDNYTGPVQIDSILEGNVFNEDSNYDETFWERVDEQADEIDLVTLKTLITGYVVSTASHTILKSGDQLLESNAISEERRTVRTFMDNLKPGTTLIVEKRVAIVSSLNHKGNLSNVARGVVQTILDESFVNLLEAHSRAWSAIWEHSDIIIDGDVAAQQGIRFNIFQLNQTYTGKDARLNIGPKGFTGEKYGGSTYWDTEAYCIPFYLGTANPDISRNLLQYRYNHLEKAIENAGKLGFSNGAALYPMVTMNGEECHNEWEITFEEIHRNGAIAYAIYDYTRYTGETAYQFNDGLDVLVGVSRFWAQRVNWSEDKQKFVILGVTGPNEYENNVNNNWYTNRIAAWTLNYTISVLDELATIDTAKLNEAKLRLAIDDTEVERWLEIINEMYYPVDPKSGIFLQQDGFLDKEIVPADQLDSDQRPLNQHWSWDKILRSCYIKQADVLQGLYFFEEEYSVETLAANFAFYEPITVHESSLSACIHAILASRIGDYDKAYEMYLQTARLDIDDINNDTHEGCHITSMAGTWMVVTKGFGGMRIQHDRLILAPFLPLQWKSYSFHLVFRGTILLVTIRPEEVTVRNKGSKDCNVSIYGHVMEVAPNQTVLQKPG